MGRAHFDQQGFLAAARALIAERGPQSVTIDSVAERLKAPKGSFYYRFASRDELLGEVWLATVLAYQEGFVAAIEAGEGLSAALHTPAWARRHLEDARLLMLYSRHDFVQGDWPAPLRRGVADQAERFQACLQTFARGAFGGAGPGELRRAAFVLAEVPLAAVKPHLQRSERPPKLVDELITKTYHAIVGVQGELRQTGAHRPSDRPGSASRGLSPSRRRSPSRNRRRHGA
jgi:AcrR family transcriptional regulator